MGGGEVLAKRKALAIVFRALTVSLVSKVSPLFYTLHIYNSYLFSFIGAGVVRLGSILYVVPVLRIINVTATTAKHAIVKPAEYDEKHLTNIVTRKDRTKTAPVSGKPLHTMMIEEQAINRCIKFQISKPRQSFPC